MNAITSSAYKVTTAQIYKAAPRASYRPAVVAVTVDGAEAGSAIAAPGDAESGIERDDDDVAIATVGRLD